MNIAFLVLLFAQAVQTGQNPNGISPTVLITGVIGWCALWSTMVIVPFYNKRELLSEKYQTNGRISSAVAFIESKRLISSLAAMFNKAIEPHKGRKSHPPMEELLDSTQVLPDLQAAQDAMAEIENLKCTFDKLCARSCRLWQWALTHILTTPIILIEYFFLQSYDWVIGLIIPTAILSASALVVVIVQLIRFHSLCSSFNSVLDACEGKSK